MEGPRRRTCQSVEKAGNYERGGWRCHTNYQRLQVGKLQDLPIYALTIGLPHITFFLREEDAGEYHCLLAGEEASVSTSCRWERVFLQHLFISHVCQADGVQRTWSTWPTPGSRPASGAGGELEGRQREAGRRVAGRRYLGPCGHS